MLESLLRDVRYSVRALWLQPGFVLAAVLTLALGIGANTAVFSAIEGRLLRELPYPDSERLVHVYNTYPGLGVVDGGMTVPDYLDRRAHAPALADSGIYHDYSFDLSTDGVPQRVAGVVASPSLFSTLGVGARMGRTLLPEDARAGHEQVVVLSDALWRNGFGADVQVVGREIRVSGRQYRVVGVMPAEFAFPRRDVALWVPFVPNARQLSDGMRGFEFAMSVGRLAPGATLAQLHGQFDAIVAANVLRLGNAGAESGAQGFSDRVTASGFTGRARSLQSHLVGDVAGRLWLLQSMALLVLLGACANVANLVLIRLSSRQRELGMRAVLGASRWRIARQLLVESALLASAGGVLGVGVAALGMALIRRLGLDGGALGFDIGLRLPVLGMAFGATALAALICVSVPWLALSARDGWRWGRGAGRGSTGGRVARRQRDALVILQVALAMVLLFGSGLLVRSFWQLQQQDPGFARDGVLSVSVNLTRERYRDVALVHDFATRLLAGVRTLPGVVSVGATNAMPLSEDFGSGGFEVEGGVLPTGGLVGNYRVVDEGFFDAMGIAVREGRAFLSSDTGQRDPVAIVDEALARRAFGTRSAVGQRIATRNVDNTLAWRTIVGVVADVRHDTLAGGTEIPTFYFSMAQQPTRIFRMAIRTNAQAATLMPPLRALVAEIDPEQPLWDITSMQARVHGAMDGERTTMQLLILFAGVALAMCCVGLYGVLAFAVAQRRGEIGVRMALGAAPRQVEWLVLREAGRLLVLGVLAGALLALACVQPLRASLFGIGVLDPLTLIGVLLMLVGTALAASWIPARRAVRLSPVQALRQV